MPQPPHVHFRPMTAGDIDATGYIRKAALEWLDASQNKPRVPWQPRRFPHFEHLLRTDADAAWVAEVDGTVAGYSMSFVRGEIWFLAQLFVQPELHGLDIGRGVLGRSMEAGKRRGARVFSVVSSTSPVSQSLYMRHGMFATGIGYRMSGPVEALRELPAPPTDWQPASLSEHREAVAALDREVWGASRMEEHELYASGAEGPEDYCFAFLEGAALAGYGYAASNGHIGPFAAMAPELALPLLRAAGDWLAEREVSEGWGHFLSHNATVVKALLDGGWRVSDWTFLLTSAPFGRFDRYVPSGGLLL
jgi:GNAT superfamily N-acetyltransferase